MILKGIIFYLCLIMVLFSALTVVFSEGFGDWSKRESSEYYLEQGFTETGSSNIVSSVVWGFRGFDTLGEETVLFASAVAVFTIIIFGFKVRERG